MAKRQLTGKRVIVTGASSGIGWCLAKDLARHGCRVCAVARREDRLLKLQAEIRTLGGNCEVVVGDVTQPELQRRLLNQAQTRWDGLDILINNAGIGAMGPFADAAPERMRQVFEVNFFAATELIRESLPLLRQGVDPLIVNIGSVLGHRAVPLKSEYCASKFALHGFSDALRAELSSEKIGVLLVSPSTTDSEFFDQAIEDTTQKNWKNSGAMPPQIVAAKTIRAIQARKHEIILTTGGKLLVWFDRLLPGLADRVIAKYGK